MALLLMCSPAVHAGEKLRIATEGAYPPFNFINDAGNLDGFDVDLAQALCKAMDVECELVAIPWDNIIEGLLAGKYDAIIACMAKTSEREKSMDFTDSYNRSRAVFVGRASSGITISPEGLRGKTICAQGGTVQAEHITQNYKDASTIVLTKDVTESFDLLVKGKVDLVLADSLVIYSFLKTEAGRDFDFVGEPLPADDPSNAAYIAVRKGDDKLRERFNRVLQDIRMDGTYDRINRKYFPFSIY
jgi:polar amino acid transport system substrate-binding protein